MSPLVAVLTVLLSGAPVFERVDPVEVRTGVMRLRTVEAPLLEVPDADDRAATTWREARFSRLWAIDFDLETRYRDRSQLEDRGALLLAARTTSDDLVALDDRVRALLASLGADGFTAPLGGIQEATSTFLDLAPLSVEPSWACAFHGSRRSDGSATVYRRNTRDGPDGNPVVVGSSLSSLLGEQARRICDALRSAAREAAIEELRTLPVPRQIHEVRVEMEAADTLPDQLRREDAPSLPTGVELFKRKVGGVARGSSSSPGGARSTYSERDVEWSAAVVPAPLSPDLLARGAHVSRWTIRERERRLGVAPRDDGRTVAVRTAAFIPIQPARMEDDPAPPAVPVDFNAELFEEDVAHILDAGSSVDGEALEDALRGGTVMNPQWLRSEGWLMVVCREDGTASYALPPTSARSPVTSAGLFCAALERMLPPP